jgi:TonB family protein
MNWTKENMFEPSGCLTRDAFEALLNHQLPAGAKAAADEHLESCPFCSDALEGYTSQSQGTNFASLLEKTDEGFDKIMKKNQSKSGKKRTLWISISTAATILMLVGLFLLTNRSKPKMQVAQNIMKDSISKKSFTKNKELADIPEKEQQKQTKPKAAHAKPEQKEIYSPLNENKTDADKNIVVENDRELKKAAGSTITEAAPVTNENSMVVADEIKTEDFKEKIEDRPLSSSQANYKRAADSPALKNVSGDEQEPVLLSVEQMPEFPGGIKNLTKYLKENLKYPTTASDMGISGKVVVQFVVEKDGRITNIKVLRGIGGGCDEEAVRVVSMMPNWKPGTQNGKPVPVYYYLPISFILPK